VRSAGITGGRIGVAPSVPFSLAESKVWLSVSERVPILVCADGLRDSHPEGFESHAFCALGTCRQHCWMGHFH
jgi:hypothetical protein